MVAQAVASVGRRTFPVSGSVTLTAGGQTVSLSGREAVFLVEVAYHLTDLRAIEYGVLLHEFTPDEVRTRLWPTGHRKSYQPVKLVEGDGRPPLAERPGKS